MAPLLFEIGLDIGPFYFKGLDIGCKFVFSGLVIGWWSKIWAGHPYPTQIWVAPPPNELVGTFAGVILQVTLIYIFSLEMKSNVLLTKIMSFLITVIWKEVP